MKKILCAILVLLTLAACSGKKEVAPLLCGISFSADVSYYNENYKGECTVSKDGALTVKITEPEELSGYTVKLSNEGITAEYLGLSFTPTANNMPASSVLSDFYRQYSAAAFSKEPARSTGDGYRLSGEGYTLWLTAMGLPQKAELPDESFCIYFYNVAVEEAAE